MKNIFRNIFNITKLERIIKTFIETFCSYIAVNIMCTNLTSKSALYGLLAGAIGSAISVVVNIKKGDKA